MARQDSELGRWFEQHRAFQKAMRAGFQQIEVPAHLKISLLTQKPAQQKPINAPRIGMKRISGVHPSFAVRWWSWRAKLSMKHQTINQIIRTIPANMSIDH